VLGATRRGPAYFKEAYFARTAIAERAIALNAARIPRDYGADIPADDFRRVIPRFSGELRLLEIPRARSRAASGPAEFFAR
jgi:hypothetical protein